MKCAQAKSLFSLYLDGAVTGTQMRALSQHLETCAGCTQEYLSLHRTQQLLEERSSVAATLQRAMLTRLPRPATLEVAADAGQSRLELTADSGSLRVRQGTGGLQALGEDERTGIDETIVAEVLKGTAIAFRSRTVTATGGSWRVEGELELMGARNPIAFDLKLGDDGHVAGTAIVTQSAWGMKPYTTLFGTLKVADEVEVIVEGTIAPA